MDTLEAQYVIFDVETTGLNPQEGDRIIEIAAVKIKQKKISDTFHSFINPQRSLSAEAMQINNITEEMLWDAPTAHVILPKIIEFVGGACLVGHNVRFDLEFLCYELSRAGRKLKDETPTIDTLKMSKRFMPQLFSHRLASIAQAFGIQFQQTHRALEDVQLTAKVFNRLLDLALKEKMEKFQDLVKEFSVKKPAYILQQTNHEFIF